MKRIWGKISTFDKKREYFLVKEQVDQIEYSILL